MASELFSLCCGGRNGGRKRRHDRPQQDAPSQEGSFVTNSAAKTKTTPVQDKPLCELRVQSHTSDDSSTPDMSRHPPLERTASSTEIMIGLEDEAGKEGLIDIDETDDQISCDEVIPAVPKGRRVSITERVFKSKNSEQQMAAYTVTAQYRKQQLVELLDEHAQLVTQVSTMETDKMADKENSHQPRNNSH